MNPEEFEIQMTKRLEIMLALLDLQKSPRTAVLREWLSRNQKSIVEAEYKFYCAIGRPTLLRYEAHIRDIGRMDDEKAKHSITQTLNNAKPRLLSLGIAVAPNDVVYLDIVFHKLHGLRKKALKGAFQSVARRMGVTTLPQEVLAVVD